MTRQISSRIEKLEVLWRPQKRQGPGLRVSFWDGINPPEPYMTLYWGPGRSPRTEYHQPARRPSEELR